MSEPSSTATLPESPEYDFGGYEFGKYANSDESAAATDVPVETSQDYDFGDYEFGKYIPTNETPAPEEPGYLDRLSGALKNGLYDVAASQAFTAESAGLIDSRKAIKVLEYVNESTKGYEDKDVDELLATFSKEAEDIGRELDSGNEIAAAGQFIDLAGTSVLKLLSQPKDTSIALAQQVGNLAAIYVPTMLVGTLGGGPIGTRAAMFSASAITKYGASVKEQLQLGHIVVKASLE